MYQAKEHNNVLVGSTTSEVADKLKLMRHLQHTPIPAVELCDNIALFLRRQTLSRVLFIHHLYSLIIPVHGCIMEFGVRWGQNLALFVGLRGLYEPFNYSRHIIGFDTFAGFPSVEAEDGTAFKPGQYSVPEGYEKDLADILGILESACPIQQKTKFSLVKGDAIETVPAYLQQFPETLISLAYFDFDLYKPTKAVLAAIAPHLTKGSVLAFDELGVADFRGEGIAVQEELGYPHLRLQRVPYSPLTSYAVVE